MSPVNLPFGRTEVSIDEIRGCIDTDTASEELEDTGTLNPEHAVESFSEVVPVLLEWFADYGRDYPWRWTTDPWHVYVTEILLQRTRSDAVADIYADFFSDFPIPGTVHDADEDTIRNRIRQLGVVNHRVRTLKEAAALCVHEYDGEVPPDLDALQRPWRVGPYTARACLLFAFEEPFALVDTNTARIVSRVFEYPLPTQPHKSARVYRLLDALVPSDPSLARAFNLALLDLGALVCTIESPDCANCSLSSGCAYANAD